MEDGPFELIVTSDLTFLERRKEAHDRFTLGASVRLRASCSRRFERRQPSLSDMLQGLQGTFR